jgi:hypothetical protein
MDHNTRIVRKDYPGRTGTIVRVHEDDTVLVQWDEPIPWISDSRLPITLVHTDLLETLQGPQA